MMPLWKKRLFVRTILTRMKEEDKSVEEILADYSALTPEEKAELTDAVSEFLQG